jgi:large subunit ribosomal protein L23
VSSITSNPGQVILAPVVSEKSYSLIATNRYTFRIAKSAHKIQVRQAVEELFNVKVIDVKIISVPARPKRRGTHVGTRAGYKKAIVVLRDGDTIELFEGAH